MPRRTYTLEFQRPGPSGWTSCLEHQARRVAIIETTHVPRKLGRRAYQIKRVVAKFSGSAMRLNAERLLNRYKQNASPRPPRERGVWGRSCTTEEYLRIQEQQHG